MTKNKRVISNINWGLLVITAILLFLKWNEIDSIIGIHLNISGQIDNYGDKIYLIVCLFIGVIVNLFMLFNYALPIENQLKKSGIKSEFIFNSIYFLITFTAVSFIWVRIFTS